MPRLFGQPEFHERVCLFICVRERDFICYCFFEDAANSGSQLKGKRRHVLTKKFKDLPMKPRGAPGGPKRTPLHLADPWQRQDNYEVEKVRMNLGLLLAVHLHRDMELNATCFCADPGLHV